MATATLTLTGFLLARIAEDEQWARDRGADAMVGHRWKHWPEDAYSEMQSSVLDRCRRVLTECAAKRAIVDLATNQHTSCGEYDEVARILAAVYADHPDYRDEWRL